MWLVGRLAPDFKTIADFRKDNGGAIRKVCARFVALCRELDLFADKRGSNTYVRFGSRLCENVVLEFRGLM